MIYLVEALAFEILRTLTLCRVLIGAFSVEYFERVAGILKPVTLQTLHQG